jgi:hypothetical protein
MKNFRLIISLAFIICCLLAIIVLPSRAEENPIWKHSSLIPKIGKGEHYLLKLPAASCAVIAYSDGNTEVLANDTDWNGIAVTQEIKIYSGITTDLVKAKDRKYPHKDRRGYRVYVAKCVPHIQELPPEIQARLAEL